MTKELPLRTVFKLRLKPLYTVCTVGKLPFNSIFHIFVFLLIMLNICVKADAKAGKPLTGHSLHAKANFAKSFFMQVRAKSQNKILRIEVKIWPVAALSSLQAKLRIEISQNPAEFWPGNANAPHQANFCPLF